MKRKLPRSWKIAIYSLVIAVCFCIGWVMMELPIVFPRLHMLSAERQNLLGPSNLVDVLENKEYSEFEKLLVGETEHGITFFCLNPHRNTRLYYREKIGDVTVVPAPTYSSSWHNGFTHVSPPRQLPIYVFHEYPTAVRAEMEIAVANNPDNRHTNYTGDGFSFQYQLSAERSQNDFFLFRLELPEYCEENADELYAMQMLSRICYYHGWTYALETASITLRLYDASGKLLTETTQVLRSDIGIAHNWQ